MKTRKCKEEKCRHTLEKKYEQMTGYCHAHTLTMHPLTVIRKINGLGQIEFAKILGACQSNISKIEARIIPDLTVKSLVALRDVFKINLNMFADYQTNNAGVVKKILIAKQLLRVKKAPVATATATLIEEIE